MIYLLAHQILFLHRRKTALPLKILLLHKATIRKSCEPNSSVTFSKSLITGSFKGTISFISDLKLIRGIKKQKDKVTIIVKIMVFLGLLTTQLVIPFSFDILSSILNFLCLGKTLHKEYPQNESYGRCYSISNYHPEPDACKTKAEGYSKYVCYWDLEDYCS